MSAIGELFRRLRGRGEMALIGFFMGCYPSPEECYAYLEALTRGGVDLLELGIPFSDPIADGPTIQEASFTALKRGATPSRVLEVAVWAKRELKVPIALLSYYNILYAMGLQTFLARASEAGIDGLIIPDLPVEEAEEYKEACMAHGLDTIFLVAPNTSNERARRIIAMSSGFLYMVSIMGVTGAREELRERTLTEARRLMALAKGRIPIAVGFGISKPEHIKLLAESGVDGAVVGSAFLDEVRRERGSSFSAVKRVEELARALKEKTLAA